MKSEKKITIVFPLLKAHEKSLTISKKRTIEVWKIIDLLMADDCTYDYENIKLFLDPLMTIIYDGQLLNDGDKLFVTFDKKKIFKIELNILIFQHNSTDPIDNYNHIIEISKTYSIEETYKSVNDYLLWYYDDSNQFEITGIYYDYKFSKSLDKEIDRSIVLHVKVIEKKVDLFFSVYDYEGYHFILHEVIGSPINIEKVEEYLRYGLGLDFDSFEIYLEDDSYYGQLIYQESQNNNYIIKLKNQKK